MIFKSAQEASTRAVWMDLLRGFAILLVIFNHAILFTTFSDVEPPLLAVKLNMVLAPLRMPLMVFLSGLLLASALSKSPKAYLSGKVRRLLYPFTIWCLIIIGVEGGLSVLSGGGFPFIFLVEAFYNPIAHTWFLYYLFIFYLVALLTKRIPPVLLGVTSSLVTAVVPDDFQRFFLLFAFFMFGAAASNNRARFDRVLKSRTTLWIAAVLSLGLVAAAVLGTALRYEAKSVPLVFAGILVSIRIAMSAQHVRWFSSLMIIGKNSLVYYIAHWYGVLCGVKAGQILLDSSPLAMLTMGTAGGLCAGILFHYCYEKMPLAKAMFEWPGKRRTVVA